ncbi:sporulation protein YpjB [Gracilibacillus caseinilyticus]|uniref:Sporulation protein YpjB n=1 Tax=Gracilibacillus caseinilyticus TaxID=2932256 RepID=A0ABY4EZJ4_9BACI|nr:sporulation protein YpjB [Gracilibacillus caseinilyticus]UOQ47591.1 sporulation protein YpjB [Gracilibacillus caseinilyticus]
MRIRVMIVFFFSLMIIQAFVHSNVLAQQDARYMYTFERLVQEQRYHVALQLIENNKSTILETAAREKNAYKDVMQQYLESGIDILQEDSASYTEKRIAAQQILILWDAIQNENAPLWTTWKQELDRKMDLILSKESVSTEDVEEIAYYVQVISPVAKLHLDEEQYQDYQASISLLTNDQKVSNEKELEETFSHISQLNSDTMNKANAEYTKWLIFIVFGFIFLSLSYVAWAKYRGEAV